MIVNIESNKKWDPVDITIKFETEKEFLEFKEIVRHCDTVPDAILECGAEIDRGFVCNFMSKIYEVMDK